MKILTTINYDLYSELTKILNNISQGKESSDIISINNGVLIDATVNGFLKADLTKLFGENSIDILHPSHATKLMKLLKGGNEIYFIDDEENNKYVITNTIASISIPKAFEKKLITIPEIGEKLSTVTLGSDIVNAIFEAKKMLDAEYVTIHLIDNKIAAISINNDYEYKIDANADLNQSKKYKLYDFMPLKSQVYRYEVYKNGGDIWIKIIMNLSSIEVEYFEKLTSIGAFDGFSLI